MIIAIDGLDASGKATQTRLLAQRVDAAGGVGIVMSFPRYATPVGQAILRHLKGHISMREEHSIDSSDIRIDGDTVYRTAPEDALVLQALFLADKMAASMEIMHAAGRGHTVILDRWWQSAFAYGVADGLDEKWLCAIHYTLPTVNMNIFIDVPPEEAFKRRPEARDRYERDREKQKAVRTNYERLWAANAGPGYVKIDGLGAPSEVHERIWYAIVSRP